MAIDDEAPGTTTHSFAEVTSLTPSGRGRFEAEVDPEWTIGGKPNGGCLLAMLGRAASFVSEHEHVIAASAHYLSSPDPGRASIETQVLRTGRSASHVRARMSQDDRVCVETLIMTSFLDPGSKPYWDAGAPETSAISFDECVRLVAQLPSGNRVAIMDQVEVRLEPHSSGFTRGNPARRGELRGWLSLPAGEPFDPVSLLYAVDAFPPATFDIEFAGWVPTLEMTVYIRALPAPGPVRVLQKAQVIDGQRVDEACTVWDAAGRLVAQGYQLAGIRLA